MLMVRICILMIFGTGLVYSLRQDFFKKAIQFWTGGSKIYGAALLRLFAGGILSWGGLESHHPHIFLGFGILLILSGLAVFVMGAEKSKAQMLHFLEGTPVLLRLLPVLAAGCGALLFLLL